MKGQLKGNWGREREMEKDETSNRGMGGMRDRVTYS